MWTKSRSRKKLQVLRDTDMDWPRHSPPVPWENRSCVQWMVAVGWVDGAFVPWDVQSRLSPFAELGSWKPHWYRMVGTAWVCAPWTMSCGLVSCSLDAAEPPLLHIRPHLPILLFGFPLFSTFWKSSDLHGEILLHNLGYKPNLISGGGFPALCGSARDVTGSSLPAWRDDQLRLPLLTVTHSICA